MNIVRIPKRKNEWRTLYCPDASERIALNAHLQKIRLVSEGVNIAGGGLQHGFQPARSPTTNALQHINKEFSLCMDLEDFFDSVTPEMVPETIRFPECFPDGAARQGLPTSPALANIAAARMDAELKSRFTVDPREKIERLITLDDGYSNAPVTYTRYADDLTFSCNSFERILWLKSIVPGIVSKHGFKVKASKTKIQWAGAGRRMITGVAVDSKIHPSRSTKRRLRAAMHQRHTAEARGLNEWMQVRIPKHYNDALWRIPTSPQPQPATKTTKPTTAAPIQHSAERVFSFHHDDNQP